MHARNTFKRRAWIVAAGFAAVFVVNFIASTNTGYIPQYSFSHASETDPVIIKATWKALPGQAIGIYGWNFGTSTSTATVAIQPLSSGALNPASAKYNLQIEDVQNDLVEGFLPSNLPKDIYAVWVNNGSA